jgi:sulfide:quinone oxidoreductase
MPSSSANPGREFHDVVIVGGGAAGVAVASSLLKRRRDMDIVIVEPQSKHYYQPGWTLVGAGVFRPADTEREEAALIPRGDRRWPVRRSSWAALCVGETPRLGRLSGFDKRWVAASGNSG